MKISFPRVALLAACVSMAGTSAILADDSTDTSTPPPADGGQFHHGAPPLTKDQFEELKKDRDAVFAANPDLKTQEQSLREQEKALREKIDAAVIAQDPNAAPLIAKLKEGHHHFHGGPPPDAGGDSGQ